MRNKLLFTAAMICVEMTPFGRIYTHAQAADEGAALDGLPNGPDAVVDAVYNSDGNLAAEQQSGALPSGAGGKSSFVTDGESKTVQPEGTIFDVADGDGKIQGQTADTLNAGSSSSVNLDKYLLQIANSGSDTSFSGNITGKSTVLPDGNGNNLPIPSRSGGLDVDAGPGNTNTNVLTLKGQNNYDGYTFVRGNGALILSGGGSITSQGVTEIGVGSDDSATMIVDKGSSLNLDGKASGDTPNATIGALYVANNDYTLAPGYDASKGDTPVTDSKANNRLIVQNGGQVNARSVFVTNRTGSGGIIYVTGDGSSLKAGDGGLTINAGNGTVVVDKGGRVESEGVISFGDGTDKIPSVETGNTPSIKPDDDTVRGNLIVGKGGTLVAGDAIANMNTTTKTGADSFKQDQVWHYGLTDGITENFGQNSNIASLAHSGDGNSKFQILDGTLANRTNSDGSGQALHTNMDINIAGTATFDAADTSTAQADPLSQGKTSKTGITVGGNISGDGNVKVQGSPQIDGSTGHVTGYGAGTVTLLGINSYTGKTEIGNKGTLQLGGVMGDDTAYGNRMTDRTISKDGTIIQLKQKLLDGIYERNLEDLLSNPDFKERLGEKLTTGIGNYEKGSGFQDKVKEAYLGAGTIASSSEVDLGATGKLNLAWGLDPSYVSKANVTSKENSQTLSNTITGFGTIERDINDGNSTTSPNTLDGVDSVVHLTGNVTLGRGSDEGGKSSDTALLIRKGNLAIDTVDGKTGNVTITGKRNVVVGDDLGGKNNQLLVKDGGSLTSDGNLTIGDKAGGEGRVVVGDASDTNSAASRINLTGSGDEGKLVVGNQGTGHLDVQSHGEVDANSVSIGKNGQVSVGGVESQSNPGEASGTLVATDITSVSNRASGDAALQLYGNGVIENRSGSDLKIDTNTTIALSDGVAADGSATHGTFDINGPKDHPENASAYVEGKLVDGGNGAGGLTKDGQGTLYLEADNSYTGATDVKQGTLALAGEGAKEQDLNADNRFASNNASSSEITIENGATLTGNTNDDGAAGRTVAESGGTVEANWNHSTGQLNIDGSHYANQPALTMKDGSTLSVGGNTTPSGELTVAKGTVEYDRSVGSSLEKAGKVFAAQKTYRQLESGLINVKGNVDLNSATINLQKNDNGRLYAGDAYHVLQATGKVTATGKNALTGIPAAIADMPFLAPSLAIEGNAVDVLFDRNGRSFASEGGTRNERGVAHALDQSGDNAVSHAMTGMNSAGEARRAMNGLSGEIHASARNALIQDSYLLEQAVLDRLANSDCDGNNAITHGRYDLHDHRKNGRCYNDHAVLWGQAFGSMGHNASDGNASTLHHQTAGFIMGVDTPVDDHWRVGGMVAYGRSMFNANSSVNSSGNSNNISVGAYAGSHWGRLNLRLGGFYSWNLMNMRRQVQVGDLGGRQTSHYRNGTARVFGELGYKMKFQRLEFEPFAGLSYVNQYAGSFREHGVAALYGKSNDEGLLFSNFGFRTAYNFNIGKMQMRAHAMGAYRHAFGGIVSSRQERLMVGGGDMSIGGVPLSRDSAVVRAGLTAKVSKRIDLDLSYIGQYGNQSIESGATGSVRIAF